MARSDVTKSDLERYRDRVLAKRNEDGTYRFPRLAEVLADMPDGYDPQDPSTYPDAEEEEDDA